MQVALLFGGRSGEHEVSLRSAASVAEGLRARHEVLPVYIDHEGRWFLQEGSEPRSEGGTAVFMVASPEEKGALRRLRDADVVARPGVYFPVLHGTFGEDGTVQGLLELSGVAYVGSGVAGSAASMDKALMKGLFAAASIPQAAWRLRRRSDPDAEAGLVEELGLPLFVKPANLGSSVGVSKVKTTAELAPALAAAFNYDTRIVVEQGIDAREVEVSVLGNDAAQASLPGEIIPDREFYDYDSKYSDQSRTELRIPAALPDGLVLEIKDLALRAFQAVDASGYARVDFLLERTTLRPLLNEINTIPGFTSISMFPKLWEASGLSYVELLDRLVHLGLERHAQRSALRTRFRT